MRNPYIYIIPLLLQLAWNTSASTGSLPSNKSDESKMLREKPVKSINQYPFMASLHNIVRLGQAFCGASIIHPLWVLTAAHCLFNEEPEILQKYDILVVSGLVDASRTNESNVRFPEKLYTHEKYRYGKPYNDIALILLKTSINISEYNVAKLPFKLFKHGQQPSDLFFSCKGLGWGQSDASRTGILRSIELPILTLTECLRNYRSVIINVNLVCARDLHYPEFACPGYPGGALVCDGYLVGIVASGEDLCETPASPGVYTRVDKYIPWINQIIPPHILKSLDNIAQTQILSIFIEVLMVILIVTS